MCQIKLSVSASFKCKSYRIVSYRVGKVLKTGRYFDKIVTKSQGRGFTF